MHVASVGLDHATAFVLGEAVRRIGCRWTRLCDLDDAWTGTAELTRLLAEVDVVLVGAHTSAEVARLSPTLTSIEAAVVPLPTAHADVVPLTRLGDFTAADQRQVQHAAGLLARAGAPVPPRLDAVLAACGHAASALDVSAGPLRALGIVQAAFCEPSATNVSVALRWLASVIDGGPEPEQLPVPLPRHGFWTPRAGMTDAIPADLAARLWPEKGNPVPTATAGLVLVSLHRDHVCAGNTAHLEHLFTDLVDQGMTPLGWFGAAEHMARELSPLVPHITVWINTRGTTLTGAHGRPELAEGTAMLQETGVPGLSAIISTAQTVEEWRESREGVGSVSVALQVSVPEIQGLVAPVMLACRDGETGALVAIPEQSRALAELARRWVELAHTPPGDRRLVVVLISHDPDKGKVGTASQLDVWQSLQRYLTALRESGHRVEVPPDADALRARVLEQRAPDGPPPTRARVVAHLPASDYVREYAHLGRVRACWSEVPGDFDNDGVDFHIHGAEFGNVHVVCQPSMGYGADPLALLYNPDAAPTHAFAAFYTWIQRRVDPHLVVHFGTHGALEFMPGKQTGLAHADFSHHLIMPLPHVYLYVTSNPSEAMIAKRRSYAAICNYLSAPLGEAGLHDELASLRHDLVTLGSSGGPMAGLAERVEALHLADEVDAALLESDPRAWAEQVAVALDEVADTIIALGLHVLGEPVADPAAILRGAAELGRPDLDLPPLLDDARLPALVRSVIERTAAPDGLVHWHDYLCRLDEDLAQNEEIPRFLDASAGRWVEPGMGGDPIRHRDILPTGRNTFSINPLMIPTARAVARGAEQAEALLEASREDGRLPETVALVMWGVDTIKTQGEAAAQAFALLGVEPLPDEDGHVTRLRIIPLEELGRPRIDVVVTTTGVFRDLFTCTMQLLDRAVRAVACLDEPDDQNHVARHTRATMAELGCSFEDAATRVFSNAQGMYGSGVNHVVEASQWESDDDLGKVYLHRQSHAYGAQLGRPAEHLMRAALSTVEVSFQNITGAEQSLTDNDHYFEYLGGVSASVKSITGTRPRILVADNHSSRPRVRDVRAAMRLEVQTRLLNPRWYEAMLAHGYQGVSEVGHRLHNAFGWSAVADAVDGWVFSEAAATYLFDDQMRERMSELNPAAVRAMAETLQEAVDRGLWQASEDEQEHLDDVADRLDDVVEGVT